MSDANKLPSKEDEDPNVLDLEMDEEEMMEEKITEEAERAELSHRERHIFIIFLLLFFFICHERTRARNLIHGYVHFVLVGGQKREETKLFFLF